MPKLKITFMVQRTREGGCDKASVVDEERDRQAGHSIGLIAARYDRANRVRMWMPLLECAEPARGVPVVGADERDLRMRRRSGAEDRQLLHARPAPRRPEVDDHRPAPQLPHADLLAGGRLDGEPRRGLAEERWIHQGRVLEPPGEGEHQHRAGGHRASRDQP
jgi:hypothetical protein